MMLDKIYYCKSCYLKIKMAITTITYINVTLNRLSDFFNINFMIVIISINMRWCDKTLGTGRCTGNKYPCNCSATVPSYRLKLLPTTV